MEKGLMFQLMALADSGLFHVVFKTDGATIPPNFYDNDVCALNFSHNFDPDDLVVDARGVGQTLSFAGNWHKCLVPLANVIDYGPGPAGVKKPALRVIQ